jgi:hypothetical protein
MSEANAEALESVEDALSWIAKLPSGTEKAIFRGQSQQWPLLPTLFKGRGSERAKEIWKRRDCLL